MTHRTHPPALLRRTGRTLREETPIRAGDRVVVAVSGGRDSMALLHVLALLAERLGLVLHAHGVDHGLRPEAAAELDLAERLARELGVPFSRTMLAVAPGGNLQMRARVARYAALDAVADRIGARCVATAHHANDRAETLLMQLLRGSRPRALAVLPAWTERRLRPFVRSDRPAIARHLLRHGIVHADDPSNQSRRFLRVRVREELLPLMEELAPGVVERLNHIADELTEAAEIIVTDEQGLVLPLGLGHRTQIRRALKLTQCQARIRLPGGVEARLETARATGADPAPSLKSKERAENSEGTRAKPVKSD
jgi:tRNA(Ile)-lysidine synthase